MGIESLSLCWPEWEIIEKLGEGQFGEVYKCKKSWENIEVFSAIKVISIPKDYNEHRNAISEGIDFSHSEEYYRSIVDDFTNEIRLMEKLKGNSNIVSIEDFTIIKKSSGIGWDVLIRMELLDSLSDYILSRRIAQTDVIKIGIDLCSALEVCSYNNIIHRDIKPANIFYNDTGNFKLGDFGIARKLERSSDALSSKGTPAYLAPEVLIHNVYDERVDIYSLGIVLYQLLNNNKIPFLPTSEQKAFITYNDKKNAVDRRISGEPLPPPEYASPEVAAVVMKACDFNPDNRYRTPGEFKRELLRVLNFVETGEKNNMNYNNGYNNPYGNNNVYETQKREGYPEFSNAPVKKNNTGKYIALVAVILVLLSAVGFLTFMLLKTDKHEKVITMLENGQYDDAYDYYIDAYGRGKSSDELVDSLKAHISDLKSDFDDEMLDYEEIIEDIETLESMKIKEINNQLEELRAYVSKADESVEDEDEDSDVAATVANSTEKPLQTEPIPEEVVSNSPYIVSASTLYGEILASSNVNSNRSFEAGKAIDGYYDSCWCAITNSTAGAGAEIKFNLAEKSKVSGVKIVNGNLYKPVEEEIYRLNGQVKSFTLTFSDGSKKSFTADYNGTASSEYEYFYFDTPVYTDYIILTVNSGYPGELYTGNVCLGEFSAF